jgi:hypothetical protein
LGILWLVGWDKNSIALSSFNSIPHSNSLRWKRVLKLKHHIGNHEK